MKICILDGYSVNPGDLDWSKLEGLGNLTVYDRTEPGQVAERAGDAEIVLTNKVPLSASVMASLPKLRYIGVLATGYNIVDTKAAAERGIVVTNIPAYSTLSVAQMVFAHILNITHRVAHYAGEVSSGRWSRCSNFCFWDSPLMELADKTIGIVGMGNIGTAVARVALALGMRVVAVTSKRTDALPEGVTPLPLDNLLACADIVTLHCPLTEKTRNLIDRQAIEKMKPTAILINTGRGPLVAEDDLADALNTGRIAAFGADVLSKEPPEAGNPLLTAKNAYITPHIAWATFEARERLMEIAAENVRQFVTGERVDNQVN